MNRTPPIILSGVDSLEGEVGGDWPCETPRAELVQKALEHYEEISNQACHWNSFVPAAIKSYGELNKGETVEGLRSRIAELEQFARDIAVKLGIEYTPPVANGECVYLKALEELNEAKREGQAKQDAAKAQRDEEYEGRKAAIRRAEMADARNALLFKEKADAIARIAELEAQLDSVCEALDNKVEIAPDDILATMLVRAEAAEAQLAEAKGQIRALETEIRLTAPRSEMMSRAVQRNQELEAELAKANMRAHELGEAWRAELNRAEKAEAELTEAKGLLSAAEARAEKAEGALKAYPEWESTREYIWECRSCGMRYREYVTKRSEWRHKPDCARQLAINPAATVAEQEEPKCEK